MVAEAAVPETWRVSSSVSAPLLTLYLNIQWVSALLAGFQVRLTCPLPATAA